MRREDSVNSSRMELCCWTCSEGRATEGTVLMGWIDKREGVVDGTEGGWGWGEEGSFLIVVGIGRDCSSLLAIE